MYARTIKIIRMYLSGPILSRLAQTIGWLGQTDKSETKKNNGRVQRVPVVQFPKTFFFYNLLKDPQPVGTEEIPNFEISILNPFISRKYGAETYLL